MAISYPVTPPSSPAPQRVVLRPSAVTGASVSPYTLTQQVYKYDGQIWQMDVYLPPMTDAQARPWIAFLISLNGRYGTFTYGDPSARVPRGTVPGTPLVNGASQTGQELDTKGWTAGQTGILLAGDYIQFGSELHRVMKDVDSDGSGLATLDIFPRIRTSPADNAAITVQNTTGLWRLVSDEMPWEPGGPNGFTNISFSCAEAL